MYEDPHLVGPVKVDAFKPRLKELWLEALSRPDAETRRRAADAIGQAYSMGMTALADTAPRLVVVLDAPDQHPIVRLAAARALIRLDASDAAANLLAHNQADGLDMLLLLTDPALARWKHEPACATWIERLNGTETLSSVRLSAIDSLGTIRHEPAFASLLTLADDRTADATHRLAAARAAGACRPRDDDAAATGRELATGQMIDRLVAVSLLSTQDDAPARTLLLQLARDEEPAVAGLAIGRILEIDPLILEPAGPALLVNADPKVRRLAAECVAAQKSTAAVSLLATLFDDPAPDVRNYARKALAALDAEPGLSDAVRSAGTAALATDLWRSQEQAVLLLGKLDHEPAFDRFVELIDAERLEVRIAAAAALRWLAIPESASQLHEIAQRLVTDRQALLKEIQAISQQEAPPPPPPSPDGEPAEDDPKIIERRQTLERLSMRAGIMDRQTAQLIQALGRLDYREAEPLMMRHVPKDHSFGVESRAASVWSLGLFRAGKPDEALASTLASRLSDVNPFNPEAGPVRRMSAVTLGRMKAASQTGVLQNFYKQENTSADIGGACRWALIQISGQDMPPLDPIISEHTGWFLEPME